MGCIKKMLLSLLLALAVTVSMPLAVFAEDSTSQPEKESLIQQKEETGSNQEGAAKDSVEDGAGDKTEEDAKERKQEGEEESFYTEEELAVVDIPESRILNAAPLNTQGTRSSALNDRVGIVMKDLVSEGMSTYEQTKACYDYLLETMSYGNHMAYLNTPIGDTTCSNVFYTYGEEEGFASVALTAQVGMCNAYASAFIVMARRIGLDANLVKGYTRSAGGGMAYHEWAEIVIDGERYVFDPQLDQDLMQAGLGSHQLFCKTYDQVGSRYRVSSRV